MRMQLTYLITKPRPAMGRALAFGLASIGLVGCASFTDDGGMAPIVAEVSGSIGKDAVKIVSPEQAAAARMRVEAYLRKSIDPDTAVQIALLNNRGLQADYNALGISEAAYVAASLPPTPTLSIDRLASGATLEIERKIAGDLLALATLSTRSEIARSQFEAARQKAVEATFRTAGETRRAWYRVVASRNTVGFLEQALASANVVAEITTKLGESGGATKISQARAIAFQAEVAGELAQARLKASTDREALTRMLGLWGADVDYQLPRQLPRLPIVKKLTDAETDAIRRRVDLAALRLELDALARSLGLTDATRFVSLIDATYGTTNDRNTSGGITEMTFKRRVGIDFQIPIFDLGETETRLARETYMQAANRLVEKAINIRSEVRASYTTYRSTHDIATLYQARILPLRKTINEQALLNYNGMLIDVVELLTTARESAQSNVAAIAAKRDFFIAAVDLEAAMIGGGSSSPVAGAEVAPTTAAAPGGH